MHQHKNFSQSLLHGPFVRWKFILWTRFTLHHPTTATSLSGLLSISRSGLRPSFSPKSLLRRMQLSYLITSFTDIVFPFSSSRTMDILSKIKMFVSFVTDSTSTTASPLHSFSKVMVKPRHLTKLFS